MARCIERQLAEPIPKPSSGAASTQKRAVTPRPNLPPFPTLGENLFNLALGNDHAGRDDRKANHPISLCRNLVRQVDTPLSPPDEGRGPLDVSDTPDRSVSSVGTSVEAVASHFD